MIFKMKKIFKKTDDKKLGAVYIKKKKVVLGAVYVFPERQ